MTNEMLKEQLLKLGISKKEFAEKFNISQSAVNNWSNKPIPGWVEAVIDMMLELQRCIEFSRLQGNSGINKLDINMSDEDYVRKELKKMKLSQAKLLDKLSDLEKNLNSISLESHSNKSK